MGNTENFDQIGIWSEIKIKIVEKYASAYSRILALQKEKGRNFYYVYIDGFAGSGQNISRATGEIIFGSPLAVLQVEPKFSEYHFVDLKRRKVDQLRKLVSGYKNVHVHEGDCNDILLKDVLPTIRYDRFQRGLCLLDPYGMHLRWEIIQLAGHSKSIEIFLNFPIGDMNRNVFRRNQSSVNPKDIERLNTYWGDESWKDVVYRRDGNLFGWPEKVRNEEIVEGFRKRLINVAKFKHVPKPIPMKNSKGSTIYNLFFASNHDLGGKIADSILKKYKQ